MQIKFSRHAKRRADLYKIPESTILEIIGGKEIGTGTHEIIQKVEGFNYPLKIVIIREDDIITNYPLKKGGKP